MNFDGKKAYGYAIWEHETPKRLGTKSICLISKWILKDEEIHMTCDGTKGKPKLESNLSVYPCIELKDADVNCVIRLGHVSVPLTKDTGHGIQGNMAVMYCSGGGNGGRFGLLSGAIENLVMLTTPSTKHNMKSSPNLGPRVSTCYSLYSNNEPNQEDDDEDEFLVARGHNRYSGVSLLSATRKSNRKKDVKIKSCRSV
ncbi:hypothetical protein L1887_05392 [Cichorium endivia]|nr:hypothetical protein L1887_05392 [Cichorium endivia]